MNPERRRKTSKPLTKRDWLVIFKLFKDPGNGRHSFARRVREKAILRELHRNGNEPLSEETIKELTKTRSYYPGQTQAMNMVFAYCGLDLPYRLCNVSPVRRKFEYKLLICKKPGPPSPPPDPSLVFQHD